MMSMQYQYLKVDLKDSVASVKLNREPNNSLNLDFLREIDLVHQEMEKDRQVKAILLTAEQDGYFSNGLDIDDLLKADANAKLQIFEQLYNTCLQIFKSGKIHVSFINGHAMAGGAVLAAMSDFRFFLAGPYRFCFSEAKIGLGLPPVFLKIIESIVGVQNLKSATLMAQAYKPPEALRIGLADEILDIENTASKNLAKIHKFISHTLQISPQSFRAMKSGLRSENIEKFSREKENTLAWFKSFFNANLDEGLLAIKEKRKAHFQDL